MKSSITLSMVLACHLLAGCRGPQAGCRVSVANAGEVALASVLVRDEAGTTYAFAGLKPQGVGPYMRASADMVGTVTVEFTTEGGVAVTNIVHLSSPVRRTFDGRVLFEIAAKNRIRVFILPTPDTSSDRDLPWAIPPAWQSAPTIPGLNR